MTIIIFGIRITINVTKIERFDASIDQAQRKADVAAIVNSEHFQALKAQAAAARASRK